MNRIITHDKAQIEHMYHGGETYINIYVNGSYIDKPSSFINFTRFGLWKWYNDDEIILMLYCII